MFLPGGIAGTIDAWARRRRGERARSSLRSPRRRGCRGRAAAGGGARVTWEWQFAERSSSDGAHTIGRWLDRPGARARRSASRSTTAASRSATRPRGPRARAVASLCAGRATAPGDRIATVSGNSIDHVVAFFACAKAGVAFVPLSWRLTAARAGRRAPARRPRSSCSSRTSTRRSPPTRCALGTGRMPTPRRSRRSARPGSRPPCRRATPASASRARPAPCSTTTRCWSSSPRAARRRRRASCSPTRTASGTTSPSPARAAHGRRRRARDAAAVPRRRLELPAAARVVGGRDRGARALVPAVPRAAAAAGAPGDHDDGRADAVPAAGG